MPSNTDTAESPAAAAIKAIDGITIETTEAEFKARCSSHHGIRLRLTKDYELTLLFSGDERTPAFRTREPKHFFCCMPDPSNNGKDSAALQIHCFLGALRCHGSDSGFIVSKRLDRPGYYVMVDCLDYNKKWRTKAPEMRALRLDSTDWRALSLARLEKGIVEQRPDEKGLLQLREIEKSGLKIGWVKQEDNSGTEGD